MYIARVRIWTRGGRVLGVAAAALLLLGCKDFREDAGELLVSKMIGPEGGDISGGGLSLTFPPGALAVETQIEIRASKSDLSAADYEMEGNARAIHPEELILKVPAAARFSGASGVLFHQDGLTVAANGDTAYINELNLVAEADAGTPRITAVQPTLGATPDAAGETFRDLAHFRLEVRDTQDLDMSLTLYDVARAYMRPLNGSGTGDCGMQLGMTVIGGSITGGCTEGFTTASIRTTSAFVEFDAEPFLSGSLDTPVAVGVVAGDDTLAYQLGFFSFETDPCFQETCSMVGTCMETDDGAICECPSGFTPGDNLTCQCVPMCAEGQECGQDSCGGDSCGDCGDGEMCDGGTCVPQAPDDTGMTDGMTDDGMTDGMTDDGTTGDPTGGTSTGGESTGGESSGGSSGGMGSGSTG